MGYSDFDRFGFGGFGMGNSFEREEAYRYHAQTEMHNDDCRLAAEEYKARCSVISDCVSNLGSIFSGAASLMTAINTYKKETSTANQAPSSTQRTNADGAPACHRPGIDEDCGEPHISRYTNCTYAAITELDNASILNKKALADAIQKGNTQARTNADAIQENGEKYTGLVNKRAELSGTVIDGARDEVRNASHNVELSERTLNEDNKKLLKLKPNTPEYHKLKEKCQKNEENLANARAEKARAVAKFEGIQKEIFDLGMLIPKIKIGLDGLKMAQATLKGKLEAKQKYVLG